MAILSKYLWLDRKNTLIELDRFSNVSSRKFASQLQLRSTEKTTRSVQNKFIEIIIDRALLDASVLVFGCVSNIGW